jgi:cation diffusion facilitator CzcD-associated flavoprotein CzcO
MRLRTGARVAVIGAGPGGLAAAKHAIEAGFDVTVFEASDDLGGQWYTTAAHSGVWPGMRTNTSRAMTAFSDFAAPDTHELHPLAEQIHGYLRAYAAAFDVTRHIRFGTTVTSLRPEWEVDGEPFDAVISATGRFHAPVTAPGLERFTGELLHAYDYPGAEQFAGRRVLVYGNGVSGHEIASDIAAVTPVVSAYRKPRYVLQKVAAGVSSDWQWYTHVGALRRAGMPAAEYGRMLRERVVRVAGNPADFGAPEPDTDILVAGHSLCQDYLAQVRAGDISCRPAIVAVDGHEVTFADGTRASVDAIVCATGYRLDIPYLDDEMWSVVGPDLRLHHRTLHPDLPTLGVIGQFALQGPYFPLLELQARWIVGVWTGDVDAPDPGEMRESVAAPPPALDSHHVLAVMLAMDAGVAPDLRAHSDLIEPLLFGPMLPPRYRLDGPGALSDASSRFVEQLSASPRAPVEPDDVLALTDLGLTDLMPALRR